MAVEGEPHLRQENRQGKFIQYGTALLGCLIVCMLYYFFMVATARVEVDIEVSETTGFKIYWATIDGGYSEARAAGL